MSMSMEDEYGSLTINIFLSSNRHWGIIVSSVSFLKLWLTSLTEFDGKSAFGYFSLILRISLSKFECN